VDEAGVPETAADLAVLRAAVRRVIDTAGPTANDRS
jgi:hypothetical protein